MNTRQVATYGALAVICAGGAVSGKAVFAPAKPDYLWYSVAHTDSVRILLNANPGSRLKLEERTKNHITISAMSAGDASRPLASFEVEESFPCPPICPK